MTRPDALHLVQAVQAAMEAVSEWSQLTMVGVTEQCPKVLAETCTPLEWATTVETFRTARETPTRAAERLALYLTLHREVRGNLPTLEAVSTEAIARKGAEPPSTDPPESWRVMQARFHARLHDELAAIAHLPIQENQP